jgi:hypothetical protein
LSGPPDVSIIAKPGALAPSQTFVVPSIQVVLAKPSNTGVPFCFLLSSYINVDSPYALLLMAYALLVSAMLCLAFEY